jgi:hypothetical protein
MRLIRPITASVLLVLLTGLGAVVGHAQGAPSGAAPKIVITKTEFDAGEVKEGPTITHKFEFRNEGTAPLEIKNVVLTCGCETVDYDKVIAPGQDGHITLLVKTAGLNGALSKLIVVTTNDAKKPSIDLVLHLTVINDTKGPQGQVIGSFIVYPSNQVAKTVPIGTAADFALTVYTTSTPPARITKAVSESGKFNVTFEPAAGNRFVVRAVSPANLPVGRYQDSVKLFTDSKETPQIEVQLDAAVVLPLRLSPKSLVFDRVASIEGETPRASKFVWIMQSGGPALEIKEVQSSLSFLTAERTENNNAGSVILRVHFTAIPPKGSHTGKIVVTTNLPAQPQLEIEVAVNVP